MAGVFELRSAKDLYSKLRREFMALDNDRMNSDLAFNFFVTAWHLVEWTYPGDRSKQTELRESSVLLQICEHLAVGAKHFEPTSKKHKSVRSSGSIGFHPIGVLKNGFNAIGIPERYLVVSLDGLAASNFGEQIKAIDLAKNVMSFWKEREREFT